MMRIDLRPGESVRIGEATVTMEEKSGQIARLAIEADRSIPIRRVDGNTPARVAAGGISGAGIPEPVLSA